MSTSSLRFGITAATAITSCASKCFAEPVGAARAVERGEQGGARKHERVRRPVLGLDEPDRVELGRAGERAQVMRHDAREHPR